ncbi:hypothetical protein TNCV_3396471 [Trichonephila clavipes]|nr:hypothetical protein TNCV_3396471 [Trichonephila clavipes]
MKDEIGGTGWKGVDGGERRKGWMGRTAGRGGGDGENSFGEAGTSSTSAPRDPEPPLSTTTCNDPKKKVLHERKCSKS